MAHFNLLFSSRNTLFLLLILTSGICHASAPADRGSYTPEKVILVYGDSISAGYGMRAEEGWVALLENRVEAEGYDYRVVNASVSGETTGGGVVRLEKTLAAHKPAVVVLELGGNDGLRGYPISKIRDNLSRMTQSILDHGAQVLLIGMVLPPNYGRRYTKAFENLFSDVADSHQVPFLPFLLDGVATSESLMQRDGIHPKPEAQQLLLNDIWPKLQAQLMDPVAAD